MKKWQPPEHEKLNPRAWGIPCSQSLLDNLPHPLGIYRTDGFIVGANQRYATLFHADLQHVIGIYNILEDPMVETALGGKARHEEVLRGAIVTPPPFPYSTEAVDVVLEQRVQLWVQTTEFPIANLDGEIEFRGIFIIDVTAQVQQQQAFEATRQEVQVQQAEIESQRATIRELSTPIIQVWEGILTVPLVGAIDSQRATSILENLLAAIVHYQAESVILDITGVAMVDTTVASYLISTTQACRLLGCEAALVGISPTIAQTLVHLGLDMAEIETRANLRAGIAWAFARQGLAVVSCH
jgi:anti-anti-sigma factor